MELKCSVQNYAWGCPGKISSVAHVAKAIDPELIIKDDEPYDELWMGTHPNGPSFLKSSGSSLSSFIEAHPEVLGSNMRDRFGDQFSFLFKILSVNKALSIQAHPNKSHAEILHKERPDVYKDPNHKPEMAIALTEFHALCGFRPKEEIVSFLKELPELRRVVGEDCATSFLDNPSESELKNVFASLMRAAKDHVASALKDLSTKINNLEDSSSILGELFQKLYQQYPGDGGCFAIYLLNCMILQPGEAIFLGPNIIHAYLSGDCIECMACSDNVVRAGLTPKYQDMSTLVEMLEYTMSNPEDRMFEGSALSEEVTLFDPPVPDFAVHKIEVSEGKEFISSVENSASILLVMEGSGSSISVIPPPSGDNTAVTSVNKGSIIFIEAAQSLKINVTKKLLAFRALCL